MEKLPLELVKEANGLKIYQYKSTDKNIEKEVTKYAISCTDGKNEYQSSGYLSLEDAEKSGLEFIQNGYSL